MIDKTLTGITALGKIKPGSDGNEVLYLPTLELEPHHWIQFSVIPQHPLFVWFLTLPPRK